MREKVIHLLSYKLLGFRANRYVACLIFLFSMAAYAECRTVVFTKPIEPSLTETETRLICGDPAQSDRLGQSWQTVPISQARFHLQSFLQDRAYFEPVFTEKDGVLFVDPGVQARIKSWRVRAGETGLDIKRRRGVVGETMTPRRLNDIESWLKRQLQAKGYPCPIINSSANASSGVLENTFNIGATQRIVELIEPDIEGMAPGVLGRYYAFKLGQLYSGELLELTERRIEEDGILQSIRFRPVCPLEANAQGVKIQADVVAGAPRLLSVGFGANTEGVLLVRANWRHNRLWRVASHTEVKAVLSAREQQFEGSFSWHPWLPPENIFFRPALSFNGENEKYFQTVSVRGEIYSGFSWESEGYGGSFRVGPALEQVRTIRGSGPAYSRMLALEADLNLLDHIFEYFKTSPRSGANLQAVASFNKKGWLSDITAHRLRLSGEVLWNARNYDPPFAVVALRGVAATTMSMERPGPATLLPPDYRTYLGGSSDLRGFSRQELPTDGEGGMSSFYLGVETRFSGVLPWNLEPLFLFDVGALGSKPVSLDMPIYWSPGFGMRFESPIGTFRGTLANGFVGSGVHDWSGSHWQLYLSLGEEF